MNCGSWERVSALTDYNNPRMRVTAEYTVTVNGERRSFSPGTTLAGVVASLGLAPERLAIELNREIVRRPLWETTTFDAGAEIEIVQFVGGG
jgi:thiamine biosynthesis protein ThiS